MGLSAGAIYVSEPGVAKEVAIGLGLMAATASPVGHGEVGFDLQGGGIRLGEVGGWSVILGSPEALWPHLETLSAKLAAQSPGRKIFFWLTESASGTVFFELHENGELRRKWAEGEGTVLEDVGEPIPEEAGVVDRENHESGPLHDEWTVMEIAEKLTGLSVDQQCDLEGPLYPGR